MEQPTDQPTAAGIGQTVPGEGLRAYLVPGLATPHNDWRTHGSPAELAAMFADLAARLALIDSASLPDGAGLSVVVSFQPDTPAGDDTDAAAVAIVNAAAAMLTPGVGPRRSPLGKGMQYGAGAQTAAGLNLVVFSGVQPTDVERAMLDAVEVARVEPAAERRARAAFLREAADADHVPTMLPADDETPTRLFVITCSCDDYEQAPLGNSEARAAWRAHVGRRLAGERKFYEDLQLDLEAVRLGHVITIEPAGMMDAAPLVVAVCSCGDYRSGATFKSAAREAWRQHRAARLIEAAGGASS